MPENFNWPAYSGPSSKVIRAPSDWCDFGLLVPHECIRWWDRELLAIVSVYDPVKNPQSAWKTKLLFDFLDNYYIPCVRHHHSAEENIYNPGIEKKMGGPIPGNIKSAHEDLIARLDKLSSFRASIGDGRGAGSAAGLAEFKSSIINMIQSMETHLAEEETVYPGVLRQNLTEQEEQALVGQIIQGLGLDGNKKFLPPIVYAMCMWKGEQGAMEWLATATPPPIQFAFKKCWVNDFYENQLCVLDGLKGDEPITPQTPVCNACHVM